MFTHLTNQNIYIYNTYHKSSDARIKPMQMKAHGRPILLSTFNADVDLVDDVGTRN